MLMDCRSNGHGLAGYSNQTVAICAARTRTLWETTAGLGLPFLESELR